VVSVEAKEAAAEKAPAVLWRFGVFELDGRAGELRRRGVRLPLRGLPLRLLACLLERPGEVVTRDELRHRLWDDATHLDFDNSLNSAVTRLRAHLDDEAANPRFVETLPRVGYRFIAPVQRAGSGTASSGPERNETNDGRLPLAPAARPRRARRTLAWAVAVVAVLIAAVGTAVRTAPWLGGAGSVAASSGQPAGGGGRGEAVPPGAATPSLLVEMTGDGTALRAAALDAYVRGRRQWNRRTARALWDSVREMERAVAAAPDSARAYAGLAHAHLVLLSWQLVPVGEAAPRVEAAAQRALALDPGLAEAHVALASLAVERDWDWAAAQRGFRVALELDPDLAVGHQFYAEYLAVLGSPEEARRQAEQAVLLDPLSPMVGASAGFVAYLARDYAGAETHLRRTLELDPDFAPALFFLAWVEREQGRLGPARRHLDRALEVVGDGPLQAAESGYLYAVSGDEAAARRVLAELDEGGGSPNQRAVVLLALGEVEAACRAFRQGMAERERTSLFLRRDPRLDGFRGHPCYAELERTLDAALRRPAAETAALTAKADGLVY